MSTLGRTAALLEARRAPLLPVRASGRGTDPRSGTGGRFASMTRARYRSSSALVCIARDQHLCVHERALRDMLRAAVELRSYSQELCCSS